MVTYCYLGHKLCVPSSYASSFPYLYPETSCVRSMVAMWGKPLGMLGIATCMALCLLRSTLVLQAVCDVNVLYCDHKHPAG